jgi:hypothetical protein
MNSIDQLGAVKAQIAELKELEKQLSAKVKGELFESGERALEGDLFRAVLSIATRDVTDWKKIAIDLGASKQKIVSNTKQVPVNTLRVSARNGVEVAA